MRIRSIAAVTFALTATAVVAPAPSNASAPGTTTLVSRATGISGAKGDGLSRRPTISADGRFIVFESHSTNLDPDDTDSTSDIFLRDRTTGATSLVSRATGAAGAKGNAASAAPAISADGRRVAFTTAASNLDPVDVDAINDVYVRDLATSTTTLASRATGPTGPKSSGNSANVALSADGTRVLFTTDASLEMTDVGTRPDAYVRDLTESTTSLVTRATGAESRSSGGIGVGISDDGRYVGFSSSSRDLDPADVDGLSDIYVRDLDASTTTLVSRATGAAGAKSNGRSFGGELSGDGRLVVFESLGSNLDLADPDTNRDVYVRDLAAGTTTLLSRASGANGAKGNGASSTAEISADGTVVAFSSGSTNLEPTDDDGTVDVFARDLVSGITTLVSVASAGGAKGNDTSGLLRIALSGEGRSVVFDSLASNLDPADQDALPDIFVHAPAPLELTGVHPPTLRRGSTGIVAITGRGFVPTSEVSFGPGVNVETAVFVSAERLDVTIAVARQAEPGGRSVTVTNPAGDAASGDLFAVVACAQPHGGEPPGSSGGRPTCGQRPSGTAGAAPWAGRRT